MDHINQGKVQIQNDEGEFVFVDAGVYVNDADPSQIRIGMPGRKMEGFTEAEDGAAVVAEQNAAIEAGEPTQEEVEAASAAVRAQRLEDAQAFVKAGMPAAAVERLFGVKLEKDSATPETPAKETPAS